MSPLRETETAIPDLGQFCIGEWSVNQAEGTLQKNGQSVRLEPRVMDMLNFLAANPERVVPKDELMAAVWGGAFVEEGALSQAIHALRKVLGDDARQPRFIQTIPKRGYRLVAPVIRRETFEKFIPEVEIPVPNQSTESTRPSFPWASRHMRLQVLALIPLVVAAVWITSSRFQQPLRIVVLPFENRGTPEGDDAYLADGLTDEIANALGSISSLQVVSSPSKQTSKTASEMGRQLKVQYILQGAIQWAKDPSGRTRVRVMPRLIRVEDGVQVWADAFEEPVDNIFEVEEKLSQSVVSQMGIALRPEQKRAIERPPTAHPEAYQAYIRGLGLRNQPFYSEEHLNQAVPLFERAVKLDPGFAAAWAQLSQTYSYLAFNNSSPERVNLARTALAKAQEIDPDAFEVRLAKAYYMYRCLGDFAAAEKQLKETSRRFPNRVEALESLGLVLRRTGKLEEAIETFKDAIDLDPQEVRLRWWIGETFRAMRKYAEAGDYLDQAVSMAPDQAVYWMEKGENLLAWTGDPERVWAVIADSPDPKNPALAIVAFQLDLYQRNYKSALSRLKPEVMSELAPQARGRVAVLSVVALERLGDHAGALAEAETNRHILEERVAKFPGDFLCRSYLAVTLAQLGEGPEALSQANEAVLQSKNDLFSGPRAMESLALVRTTLGQSDGARSVLASLSRIPYQGAISSVELRLSPAWAPLRERARRLGVDTRVPIN
jgi:DNA-binding winged helix-turn-helix (wHTH) protein/TolB-like protein/cytochrome c-type biogenesis protein CcmH/NrfG